MTAAGALLEVRDLEVGGPGGPLLAPSSFALHDGERVLLVGPSGSGKSLVTDVLLGFLPESSPGLTVRGSLRLGGVELLGRPVEAREGLIGAVFQLHALGLFDDLTVEQNLGFGSPDAERRAAVAESLGLVKTERPVVLCSGGERVRAALARTLLRDAGVLVADEPTTGLDPSAGAQVVEALKAAHRRLTIVVTHDHAAFRGFADAVLALDPATRTLKRLAPDEALPEAAAPTASGLAERRGPGGPQGWRGRALRRWTAFSARTADWLVDALSLLTLPRALLDVVHPLHGPRVRRALARDLAPGVGLFAALGCVLVSLTATFFLFERLPRRAWSETLLQDDLLSGLGLVLTRVVVPLMASILLAAKLGASSAAHIGHMALTRQLDSLRLLRVSLRAHLLAPVALGQVVAAWVHGAFALGLSFVASVSVFLAQHPGWSSLYARRAWFHGLSWEDALWVAGKLGASALAVALTAWRVASAPKRSPEDVLRGIHRTLLVGLLLVLAIHAAFAFAEF